MEYYFDCSATSKKQSPKLKKNLEQLEKISNYYILSDGYIITPLTYYY